MLSSKRKRGCRKSGVKVMRVFELFSIIGRYKDDLTIKTMLQHLCTEVVKIKVKKKESRIKKNSDRACIFPLKLLKCL